jgi:hypothetical protein
MHSYSPPSISWSRWRPWRPVLKQAIPWRPLNSAAEIVQLSVQGGITRQGVGLPIVKDHKNAVRWVALRVNSFKSFPETLSLRLERRGLTPRRRARTIC